jgi:hypothetical protein
VTPAVLNDVLLVLSVTPMKFRDSTYIRRLSPFKSVPVLHSTIILLSSVYIPVVNTPPPKREQRLKVTVFWQVTWCSVVYQYYCSGLTYCLHLQGGRDDFHGNLKIGARGSFELLVTFYQITRHHNPEDSHIRILSQENPRSHIKHDKIKTANFPS